MRSLLERSRTAFSLLRYCVRGPLWWAMPALAMLLIAGVLGLVAEDLLARTSG